jgi:hypothetical protein
MKSAPQYAIVLQNLQSLDELHNEVTNRLSHIEASVETYLENPKHITKPDTLGKWSKRNAGPLSDIERALDDIGQAEGHLTTLSANLDRWLDTKSPVDGVPSEDIKFVDYVHVMKRLEEARLLLQNAEWLIEQTEFVTFITHIEDSI